MLETTATTLRDCAMHYHSLGANVLPIRGTGANSKNPYVDEWGSHQNHRQSADQVESFSWNGAKAIAMICRDGWMLIDFDGRDGQRQKVEVPEAHVRFFCDAIGIDFDHYEWIVQTANKGWHVWIHCDDPPHNAGQKKLNDLFPNTQIDIKTAGGYGLVPYGTIDGKAYIFRNHNGLPKAEPARVSGEVLRAGLAKILPDAQTNDSTNDWSNDRNSRDRAKAKGNILEYIRRELSARAGDEVAVSKPAKITHDGNDVWEVRIAEGRGFGGYHVLMTNPKNHATSFVWNCFADRDGVLPGKIGGDFLDAVAWFTTNNECLYHPVDGLREMTKKEKQAFADVVEKETEVRIHDEVLTKSKDRNPRSERTTVAELVEAWIADRYLIRFNVNIQTIEFAPIGSESWRAIDDNILCSWAKEFEIESRKPISTHKLLEYLRGGVTEYEPIRSWFDSLPAWDGKDYIADLASVVNTDNPELFYRHLRKWMIGAFATGYYTADGDDTINELFLILHGAQGVGKTTFLRYIVPNSLHKYRHTGTIEDTTTSKMEMARAFISINDELNAMRKTANEYLKSVLSSKEFQFRVPYDKVGRQYPRRVSFCGSTNEDGFLTDHTGNRRYLVHTVRDVDFNALKRIDIGKVWAQAMAEHGKVPHWIEKHELEDHEAQVRKHVQDTYCDGLVRTYIDRPDAPKLNASFLTTSEIANQIVILMGKDQSAPVPPRAEDITRLLGFSLRKAGFERSTLRRGDSKYPVSGYWVIMKPVDNYNDSAF